MSSTQQQSLSSSISIFFFNDVTRAARRKLDELVDLHIDAVQYVQDILHLDNDKLSKVSIYTSHHFL